MGDRFLRGVWPPTASEKGVNRVGDCALNVWSVLARDKLGLARMGKSTAASYAKYGAARSSELSMLVRRRRDLEIAALRATDGFAESFGS